MASRVTSPTSDDRSLADTVDALTECVAEPNARALFRSFARLDRAAA